MKNLKAVLINAATIVLGILMFIFLSQPYYTISQELFGETISISATGYDYLKFSDRATTQETLVSISCLLLVIILALLILLAIVNLLANCGVLKLNEKATKILNIINVVLNVLVLVCAIIAIACVGKIGWACIINLILGIALAVVAVIECLSARKAK